ncbi:hypothetical protein D3C80_1037110 [compost metagenome]
MFEGLGPDSPADIVDQHIQALKTLDRCSHHPATFAVLLKISGQGEHALARQLVDQFGTINRNQASAFGQQPFAHLASNALRCAGDQRDLVVESVVHDNLQ